jgi:hypothetical protein
VARRTPRARSPSLAGGGSRWESLRAQALRPACPSDCAGPGGAHGALAGQDRPAASSGRRARDDVGWRRIRIEVRQGPSGRSLDEVKPSGRSRRPATPSPSPRAGHIAATGSARAGIGRLHLPRRPTSLRSVRVAADSSPLPGIASPSAGAAARNTRSSRSGISGSRRSSPSCRSAWSSSASASDRALGRSGSFDLRS